MDEHVFAISVTFALALMVLIGLPLGAVLPQKYVVKLPVNVLVPLYMNLEAKAWERLFNA
jgi:hypothetical protein